MADSSTSKLVALVLERSRAGLMLRAGDLGHWALILHTASKEDTMPGDASDTTRWNHANPILEVADVRRAIAYYRDVFGLTPGWMWEERVAGLHTEHSAIEIYLSQSDSPSPLRPSVFVDDADATCEKYRAAGADIVDRAQDRTMGAARLYRQGSRRESD